MTRVLLVGVACLATLAACERVPPVPKALTVADSADQLIDSMGFELTYRGVRASHVLADTGRIYQRTQRMLLRNVHMEQFDTITGKQVSTITGAVGSYDIRLQSMDIRGGVVATSPAGKILKTEHLIYDNSRNVISSDTAFTWTGPDGSGRGNSFTADPGFKNVTISAGSARTGGRGAAKATATKPPAARGGR